MRVLGIDYGDRHVGLALSDALRVTAQPFGTYRMTGRDQDDRRFFRELVTGHDVAEIVVGYPLRMDGSAGSRAEKTKQFAAWLEKAVAKPIVFIDERLTTREALGVLQDRRLRGREKKEREDQIAAVIILATYLERRRTEERGGQDA